MKSKHKLFILIGIIVILVIPNIVDAAPPPEEGFQIDWWTVAGGGGESTDGSYNLKGTIGQHDAGSLQGGDYGLQGGFWVEGVQKIVEFIIHLPLILK
jgi:hypothetical protein